MQDYSQLFIRLSNSYRSRGIRGLSDARGAVDAPFLRFYEAVVEAVDKRNTEGLRSRIIGGLPKEIYDEALISMGETSSEKKPEG